MGAKSSCFHFPNPPQRVTNPEARGLRHLAFKVDNIDEYVAYLLKKWHLIVSQFGLMNQLE